MSTTSYRFHVCCPACCGLVASYKTRSEALSHARHHASYCDAAKDVLPSVYDVMAHHGAAQEWTPDGETKAVRP